MVSIPAVAVTDAQNGFLKIGMYIPSLRAAQIDQNKVIYIDEVRLGKANSSFQQVKPGQ